MPQHGNKSLFVFNSLCFPTVHPDTTRTFGVPQEVQKSLLRQDGRFCWSQCSWGADLVPVLIQRWALMHGCPGNVLERSSGWGDHPDRMSLQRVLDKARVGWWEYSFMWISEDTPELIDWVKKLLRPLEILIYNLQDNQEGFAKIHQPALDMVDPSVTDFALTKLKKTKHIHIWWLFWWYAGILEPSTVQNTDFIVTVSHKD